MKPYSFLSAGRFTRSLFAKTPAFLLAFLLCVSPLAPVVAQVTQGDVGTGQSNTDSSLSDATKSDTSLDQKVTIQDTQVQTKLDATTDTNTVDVTTESSTSKDSSTSPMAMALVGVTPTGPVDLAPGDTSDMKHLIPGIDQSTGALTYRYAFDIPSGRNGMTPDLGLVYNSQNTDSQSIFGFGWNSSIPSITRANKHGSNMLYSQTYSTFTSSLSGELTQLTSTSSTNPEEGTYGAKVETGDFITYSYMGGVWTAKDKRGQTYSFGSTSASRQDDASTPSNIYQWMLDKELDTNGNYISYTYYKDAGQIYPDTVSYTGNGATPGIYEVDFLRQPRTDTIESHRTAFSVAPAYQIGEVRVKVSGSWVKKYVLAYSANTNGVQSLLSAVTESGKDSSGVITTLPPEAFDYNQTTSHSWNLDTSWTFPVDPSCPVSLTSGGYGHVFLKNEGPAINNCSATLLDVNGDGLADLVQSWRRIGLSPVDEIDNVYLNTGNGWILDPSWAFPVDPTWSASPTPYHITLNGNGYTATPLDVNGDGLVDLVQSWRPGGTPIIEAQNIYLNTGSGWVLDPSWTMPVDTGCPLTLTSGGPAHLFLNGTTGLVGNCGTIPIDVNGDGLVDLVQSHRVSAAGGLYDESENVFINTGTGWTLDPSWTFPVDPSCPVSISSGGSGRVFLKSELPAINNCSATLLDVNGDGLADLVQSWRRIGLSPVDEIDNVYLNTGNGWILDPSWTFPLDPTWGTAYHVVLNGNGYGFTATPIDVNGDGLVDLVQSSRVMSGGIYEFQNIYINTGHGWVVDPTWAFPVDSGGSLIITGGGPAHVFLDGPTSGPADSTSAPLDVNGDGLIDLVQSTRLNAGGGLYDESGNVYVNSGPLALLSKITLPTGGTIQATYKPVSISGTGNFIPEKTMVLRTLTTTDPVTGVSGTDSYSYEGGKYYFNNAFERKIAGFAKVTKTDALGNVTRTYYHTGTGTDAAHGEYADMESKIGKVYRTEQYDSAGNLYSATVNKWDDFAIAPGEDFVKLVRSTNMTYDGGPSHRDTAQEFVYDNTNGNILQKTDWGEVSALPDGSFADVGLDKTVENIVYALPTSGFVIGLPSDDVVIDLFGTTVRRTRDYYDLLPLGSVTLGNQTKEGKLVGGTSYATTAKTYDPTYGVVASATDPDGNTTTYAYDAYHLYPATVTDALTHTTSYVYDYANGKPSQTTDQNGFVYKTDFDGLDRVVSQYVPDLGGTFSPVLSVAYAYTDTPLAVSVHKTAYLDALTTVDSYQYLDGLGREVQSRVSTGTSGTYNVTDTAYNPLGLVRQKSLPYSGLGAGHGPATTVSALYATYAYDPVRRVVSVSNAVGTTSNAYSLWNTTTTDPMGKVKVYYKDARENLARVDEHNGMAVYTTMYGWDANNKLVKITDALSNIRNFFYDNLGRRFSAEDLHAPGDATFGTWHYTYDDAGNMLQSVSPNGNTVNHTYDALNRELSENWTGGAGTEIAYVYDSCTNGIGKLCTVTMSDGANTSYRYNSNGAVSGDSKTVTGSPAIYLDSYDYDRQGNMTLLTYPDSAQVKYTYGADGQVRSIDRNESGGPLTSVVASIDYSPTGQIGKIQYANGATTTNTYNAGELYRLQNKLTVNGSAVHLQDTTYAYDPDGNIISLVDASATDGAKTAAYTYDDLNRLISANVTGVLPPATPYSQTYAYDAIGNILTGPIGPYAYMGSSGVNYANPHAATSSGTTTYTYDNDGNLLTSSDISKAWNYIWNYKDQAKEIDYGTAAQYAKYDQTGNRVSVFEAAGTEYYPSKYYTSKDWSGEITKDVYAGSTLVATITTNGTVVTPYYVHTDDILGSNVISDSTGAQNQLLDYFPFGAPRLNEQATSFNEEKQYGGHQYDAGTGLSYLGARYYDPTFGRFVSQDPSARDNPERFLDDPQQLNYYSYARENPITNIDPDGRSTIGNIWNNLTAGPIERYQAVRASIAQGSWQPLGMSFSNQYKEMFPQQGDSPQVANSKNMNLVMGFIGGGEAKIATEEASGIRGVAESIGSGHAFDKHLVGEGQFEGIAGTKQELANHVENVMNNADRVENLGNGVTAYGHEASNTIVVHNPTGRDMGTTYQNSNIQNKMDNLVKNSKK